MRNIVDMGNGKRRDWKSRQEPRHVRLCTPNKERANLVLNSLKNLIQRRSLVRLFFIKSINMEDRLKEASLEATKTFKKLLQ